MSQSPYMTLAELAAFVRLDQTKHPRVNAWKFIRRHGIPTYGTRPILVTRVAVQEALEDSGKARRRKLKVVA